MDVCITAPFGTVCPRIVVTHTSVFHESDDVSVFVTKWSTDEKSGLFVIVDSATNKNSFQAIQQHCSVLCLQCVLHVVTQVHITVFKEVLNPFTQVPLLFNWIIKDEFNTTPFFVLEHDL